MLTKTITIYMLGTLPMPGQDQAPDVTYSTADLSQISPKVYWLIGKTFVAVPVPSAVHVLAAMDRWMDKISKLEAYEQHFDEKVCQLFGGKASGNV